MSNRAAVARNMLWNGAGLAVPLVAGFLLAPFLIRELGTETNALWVLVFLWMDSLNLLDLGVSGAVGRTVAFHRARGEITQASAAFSTSFVLLCGVGAVVLALSAAAPALFFRWNVVPADQTEAVSGALLLIGTSVALGFPLGVFDGKLWALQRFDLTNAVDIPTALVRTAAMFGLVWSGHGLLALAALTLACRAGNGLVKAWLSHRLDAAVRLRPALVSRAAAAGLFGYSVWAFLLAVTRMLAERICPQVISTRLAVALVTPQSVAAKLVGYSNAMMIAGTEVLTPLATHHHAGGDEDRQRGLLLDGGKFCLALAVFFTGLFVYLGRPFLTLWVGPEVANLAYPLLVILALGELLPMGQWVSYTTALAMSRHRGLALMCLAEVGVATVAAIVLADIWGLTGACLGVAIPAALFRGAGQMIYACRLVRVSLGEYVNRAVAPALTAITGPVIALAVATAWWTPAGWFGLVAAGLGYSLLFAVSGSWLIPAMADWRSLGGLGRFRQDDVPATTEPAPQPPPELSFFCGHAGAESHGAGDRAHAD